MCRTAIILINFFTSLSSKWRKQRRQNEWMEFANEGHFYFRPDPDSKNEYFVVRDRNIFTVVVGHREKVGGLSLFMDLERFSKEVYNLGIAYISREGSLEHFCVKGQDGEDIHEGNLNCVDKMGNLITTFINLSAPPKYWYFIVEDFDLQKANFTMDIKLVNDINVLNPFNRSLPYTVEHLAQAVFRKANATLVGLQITKRARIGLYDIKEYHWDYTTVNLRFAGFEFLTCYAESYLSFRFYVDPFQPDLWVGLGICLFLIIAIVWMYVHFAEVGNVSFSPWLFVLSTLLEEAHHVPSKINKLIIFRYIFGLWSLMSVILTNCYNGLMISNLNSPLNSVIPETFADLLCDGGTIHSSSYYNSTDFLVNLREKLKIDLISTYYQGILNYGNVYNTSFVDLQNQHDSTNCYKLLSSPVKFPGEQVIDFMFLRYLTDLFDHLLHEHLNSKGPESVPLLEWPHLALMLQLLNPRHAHFPKEIDYSTKNLTNGAITGRNFTKEKRY
ncbi:uncharacterized protein LOC118433999 [Folsomia candida]|uniref:uncharacterized protein LOC118433999 n=1 Tax=Folsomia candida TaxID=158441 RepID=UPI0016055409|nr:uncharacterized protein LOC118433999 [Folsomia candida]